MRFSNCILKGTTPSFDYIPGLIVLDLLSLGVIKISQRILNFYKHYNGSLDGM